ncbi:MAG: hypothetical protein MR902_06600 [Campylobacter sp.]|nr:hypothetical protein [Campylobacter sp.]
MVNADIKKVIENNYDTAKTIYEEFENTEKEIINEFLQSSCKILVEKNKIRF